jgi:hypothetical protein
LRKLTGVGFTDAVRTSTGDIAVTRTFDAARRYHIYYDTSMNINELDESRPEFAIASSPTFPVRALSVVVVLHESPLI